MDLLEDIVQTAELMGASDIHITEDKYAKLRVKGLLIENNRGRLFNKEDLMKIFHYLELDMNVFEKEHGIDKGATVGDSRLRVHFYRTMKGISLSIRLIPKEIPEFDDLHLPKVVTKFLREKNGLVIVTGSTGSGKSTTLASLINLINKNETKKIVTVEDPIEYVYEDDKSTIDQREIGEHVGSFDLAIRQAMREDPDILLVGELRDLDTIQSALRMAETGHLVFGTLHTRGAAESFSRIIDVFDGSKQAQIRTQLSNVTKGVISQQLVLSSSLDQRVPLVEVLVMNDASRNIVSGNSHLAALKDNIQQNFKKLGSQSFIQSAGDLIKRGILDFDDVGHVFNDEEIKKVRSTVMGRNG